MSFDRGSTLSNGANGLSDRGVVFLELNLVVLFNLKLLDKDRADVSRVVGAYSSVGVSGVRSSSAIAS